MTDGDDSNTMDIENSKTNTEHGPTQFDTNPTEIENEPIEYHRTETDDEPTIPKHGLAVSEYNTNDDVPRSNINSDSNQTNTDFSSNQTDMASSESLGPIKNGDNKNTKAKFRTARPARMKTLSACLTLFGLFKNPSKLYQEPAMRQIYLTLLTQKDEEIQKLAITCLMAYKFSYLLPYKEHLERLMEDKTFRDELTSFSSDEESNVVIPEHRAEFIQILIRCAQRYYFLNKLNCS